MNATANANVTATFTVAATTSITTTCRATNIEMKISRNIRTCKLSKGHISNVIAMANCIKFKLSGLDGRDFSIDQLVNTTAASSTAAIIFYYW